MNVIILILNHLFWKIFIIIKLILPYYLAIIIYLY